MTGRMVKPSFRARGFHLENISEPIFNDLGICFLQKTLRNKWIETLLIVACTIVHTWQYISSIISNPPTTLPINNVEHLLYTRPPSTPGVTEMRLSCTSGQDVLVSSPDLSIGYLSGFFRGNFFYSLLDLKSTLLMVVFKNSPVYCHPFKTRYKGKGSWSNLDSKDFSDIIIFKLLIDQSLPSPLRYASRLIGLAKSLNGLKDTFSSRVNTAWKTKLLVRTPLCLQLDIVEDLTKYQRQNFQGLWKEFQIWLKVWLSKMFLLWGCHYQEIISSPLLCRHDSACSDQQEDRPPSHI